MSTFILNIPSNRTFFSIFLSCNCLFCHIGVAMLTAIKLYQQSHHHWGYHSRTYTDQQSNFTCAKIIKLENCYEIYNLTECFLQFFIHATVFSICGTNVLIVEDNINIQVLILIHNSTALKHKYYNYKIGMR